MIVARIALGSIQTPSIDAESGISRFLRRAADGVRHLVCGLHGHHFVLYSRPGHLSLRCFTCGAETRGWTIDVRPTLRRPLPPRARVTSSLPTRSLDGGSDTRQPLRPAA